MKKIILVLLALLLAVSVLTVLVACDQDPCQNGHDYDNGEIVKNATCEEAGQLLKRCKRCGDTITEEIPPAHLWGDPVETTPATCIPGVNTYTCTVCGDHKTEPIPPTGEHSLGELIEMQPATCVKDGVKAHYECQNCHKLFLYVDGGAPREVQDESELTIPATNIHDYTGQAFVDDGEGGHYQICKNCQQHSEGEPHTLTYTKVDDDQHKEKCSFCTYEATVDHDWDAGTSDNPPTCTESGSLNYTCRAEGCGATKTDNNVPPLGHDGKEQQGKPATCNEDGYNAYFKCERCNKYSLTKDGNYEFDTEEAVKAAAVIKATGIHDYQGQPLINDGANGHHQECKNCGTASATVGHTLDYVHNEGAQTHKVTCKDNCGYVVEEEACDIQQNVCSKCHEDYTPEPQKDEVTIHFHAGNGWNTDSIQGYAWYGSDDETVYVLNAWPGTAMEAETDGWYKITFQVPAGHVNVDLYFIANDNVEDGTSDDGTQLYSGNQTGNVLVIQNEIYVAGIARKTDGEIATAYATADAALEAEQNVEPQPTDAYVLVGKGVEGSDLKEWTDELPLQSETLDSGVLHYSLKVTFKAGDEFKVRLAGDEGFLQKNFGFSNVNWDSANEAVKDDLIEAGDSDNIKVKKGFTGYVNVYGDSDQLTIYVESVEEEVPGPQPEKDAVIVHFHKIEGWGTSFHVYIWYGSEELNNKVEVLGKWPGTGTLSVEEGSWYKATFSVDKGHVGVDLKIIVSDGTIQTGDILVEQAEIYIPGLTKDQNGTKAYKTAQEAEAADSVKVEFAYFLSGSMNEWGTPDTHKFTAGSDGTYTLKGVALKKDDQFKIRDNALKPTYLGYDELAKSGTAIGKFSKFDKAGDSGYGNFVVNEDCTVDITFNPTAKTIKIDLAAHVHVKADAITVVTAAQCETVGAGYYKCTQCDKRLNAEGKEIGDTETIEIPALGHQADKKHEKVSATCETDGTEEYYDCVRNCGAKVNQNGEVIPQEQLTIPATGHKYTSAEEAWTWNSDHSTATLHLVCTTDGDHTKTIDVTPQKSSRTQDCTTEGTVTFTASITRDQIKAQLGAKDELTIDDAKLSAEYVSETSEILGHNWVVKADGYSWAEGTVTVTLVCSREAEKELTLTFIVEGKVTDPTCVDDRFTTYTLDKTAAETETEARKQHTDDDFFTAHDAFAALKDVNTVTEADSALGHSYDGQPFVDAGEGKHHQKCTRCEVYSEATEHELSFVPDGATMHRNKCSKCTYSEAPVVHDALTYEKVDGTYHRATCATCHYEGDNVTHTYGNYTHIGDKNTESHQATCTANGCGATDTQPCTTDNRDICTSCQHDFRLDVKVHFHRANAWTGSVYVWAWYEGDKNGNCVVTGDKPTSECLMKSETVAGSTDWWQIEIKYPRDVTCKIMFTSDSNFTHKTSDHAFVFASEIWCAKSGEVFNSSAAALEAENIPAPTSSDWFVTGTHIGWAETVADWQYAFGEMGKTAHYEVTLQLQQSNTFKFKTNDLWATCQQVAFSTTNKYTITKADGLSGETKYLIYNDYDDNFLVAFDCTLKLTYDKTTQKFTIEVVKCDEMPSAKPTFEYTIHIFVPTSLKDAWTNMYVWAFDGPIDNTKNGANINDNPTKEDVLTSSLGVWKKYTASSDKPYGSSKQGMLFAMSNWGDKFGCDNKTNEGGSDNRFKLMKDTYFRAAESNKTYPTAADAENNTNATKW